MNDSWYTVNIKKHQIRTFTSSASKLIKLAIAKPSMMSSSQDTDSFFLRRGGLCLPKPGRPSLPPGPMTLFAPQASRSEPEDKDVARSSARSTLLRRSRSRCDRDRRLCLDPALLLGPSMFKRHVLSNSDGTKGTLFKSWSGGRHQTANVKEKNTNTQALTGNPC